MDERTLKALGDPTRYRLLEMLSKRGYCVRALARRSALSESAVSQHLKILREAGLVHSVKLGYYTHYRVNGDALRGVIDEMQSLLATQRKPCDGPFAGCPESEYVRCKAYVPPENTAKEDNDAC